MKKKIFSSMFAIAVVTALLTTLLTTLVLFNDMRKEMRSGTKMEAFYVIEAYNEMGCELLTDFSNVTASRVTIVAPDGEVIFDSSADASGMENHGERPEIIDALENGVGEDTRYSGTLNEETYYYAVLLDDGNVFRISNETRTVYAALASTLPWLLGIMLIAVVMAGIISRHQTADIVKPINMLDIDDPDESTAYSELAPLIHRLKRQRRQINEQFDALRKQNNMRREFTANVSHELKTPLTSISGYAEIIQNGIAKPQDVRSFAGNIYSETQRLISLVGDILKLSHLDEGGGSLYAEEFDLKEICILTAERLSPLAQERAVNIITEGEPVLVNGYRRIIEDMVFNLCDNAIKYNIQGGTVAMEVFFKNGKAGLIVRDTGIGIPDDELSRVFERFYRVDKSHSRETGGTGLGLSIVKHAVVLHKGDINISSVCGEGTTVTVTL